VHAGSVLGLPAESTDKPLVLGEPVRPDTEAGISSLSRYGTRSKEKTGHTGTIVLLIIILLVGGVIAAIYFNVGGIGDRFNAIFAASKPEDKSAKARIVGLSPTASNKMAKAGGYVENISNDKLEGLSVEVTLQRIDNSVMETLNLPVVPDTLGPGERGKFEFEYPVDAGVATYSVLKLKSNDKQVFFTSNQSK
jgi:hypothetical protein